MWKLSFQRFYFGDNITSAYQSMCDDPFGKGANPFVELLCPFKKIQDEGLCNLSLALVYLVTELIVEALSKQLEPSV